jgi:hypothetical protein
MKGQLQRGRGSRKRAFGKGGKYVRSNLGGRGRLQPAAGVMKLYLLLIRGRQLQTHLDCHRLPNTEAHLD